jgi:hypothetical protein
MRVSTVALLALCACAPCSTAFAAKWESIDRAVLASTTPVIEKDADAEYLLWEVQIEDSAMDDRSTWTHHVVVKVFTERGRDLFSTVELEYGPTSRVEDVAGRTVKPDGKVLEVAQDSIFEQEKVKAGRRGLKAKSFALPAVQPGDVVEYRWVERKPITHYKRVHFQQAVPVRLARCRVLPLEGEGLRMRPFNMDVPPFEKDRSFWATSAENLPSYEEEPFMPPADQVRAWLLLFYSDEYNLEPERYWRDLGRRLHSEMSVLTNPNDAVRETAERLTAGVAKPEDKLRRLYEFCRAEVKNAHHPSSGLTDEQRRKLKENLSPADTLKRRVGTGPDILMLFAALARSAGFDARMARVSDRSDSFFSPAFPDDYFLRAWDVAVRVGDGWRFFDPSSPYLPFGMLGWWEEGTSALVTDGENPVFVKTPVSGPELNRRLRSAELQLADDGTLEGEVRVEYTGQLAAAARSVLSDQSPAEREEWVKGFYKERLRSAELTQIAVADPNEWSSPFTFTYHVRLPGYAQKTGKRLFLQPSFFAVGSPAPFTAAERRHQVHFEHPVSEQDDISIRVPEGYVLDGAEAPPPVRAGQISACEMKMSFWAPARTLQLSRRFFFGAGGNVLFPPNSYPGLKQLFDAYQAMDDYAITLKSEAPATGAAAPAEGR